ncbi:MAG: glycosyltransferase family 4 protein [Opitutales bacterium]|nr:glycosyltransferase family 4 protein [Opitutales bacterium]
MKILLATTQAPFMTGGAEIHADTLLDVLRKKGHQADIIRLPFFWDPPERIIDSALAARMIDAGACNGHKCDLVIGLKFPAYHIHAPRKVLWILHQHRTAFDMWKHPLCDLAQYPNGRDIRDAIDSMERRWLPEADALFANSHNVARRLSDYCDLDADALYHPPPSADDLKWVSDDGYWLVPGRIEQMKRQKIVIQALGLLGRKAPNAVFLGTAQDTTYFNELKSLADRLGVGSKIRWAGFVSKEERVSLYGRCRGVIYPPIDEDYGYVTLEAMLASKPVLTCSDSGGPLEFVRNDETGFICEPTPEQLAEKIGLLSGDPMKASGFGRAGHTAYNTLGISWDKVIETLLAPR